MSYKMTSLLKLMYSTFYVYYTAVPLKKKKVSVFENHNSFHAIRIFTESWPTTFLITRSGTTDGTSLRQ